jgi:hypothetical protein
MVLATTKRYTVDEYLELEAKAEFKSEFVDGEIIQWQEQPQIIIF